jgi:uncharacterized Ntn-hydrolase superfamily protein
VSEVTREIVSTLNRERRERIATAALAALVAGVDSDGDRLEEDSAAEWAVAYADALIAELDK